MTMNTTSRPSSSTALKVATPESQSSRLCWRLASLMRWVVWPAKAASSSRCATRPVRLRIALRSHRMPKSSSSTPTVSCSAWIGTCCKSGPKAATIRASTPRPSRLPATAGRQPWTVPTARMIVNASTASTTEARKAVPSAAAPELMPVRTMTRFLRAHRPGLDEAVEEARRQTARLSAPYSYERRNACGRYGSSASR